MSENTKAAARAGFEVWSTGAIEHLDDLVARDVVHQDASIATLRKVSTG